MLSIFDLDSYKKHLISYYYYERDNNPTSYEERRTLIERQYSDEDLLEIIKNTERFIEILIQRTANSNRTFIEFEIFGDDQHVFTNCTGGWSPDTLIQIFSDGKEAYISRYLLKQFLTDNFRLEFGGDIEENIDDSDDDIVIGAMYYTPKMIIVGDFTKLSEKYNKLQSEQNILKRSLKKDDGQI